MGFDSTSAGVAASIFLALYGSFFGLVTNIVIEKGFFKSIYTILFFFGLFRVGGQVCGVAFATLGIEHYQWLIAYLVLTAEGYFTLILAAFYFIIECQIKQNGRSWLRRSRKEVIERGGDCSFKHPVTWSSIFHLVLIPANGLVIAGGTMLAGIDSDKLDQEKGKVDASKGMRTAGQTLFLIQTIIVVLLTIYIYIKEKVRCSTVYLLFAASPFLLVRGIFGILSIYIKKMNYYNLSNYDGTGLKSLFVAYEYCLATTMEFVAACLLISNYYIDKRRKEVDSNLFEKMESDSSSRES